MKILMIAPEPFFQERGTPFSIRQRLEALCSLNFKIDLYTYSFGRDIAFNGLRIFRSFRPPWVRNVKVGLSWNKIFLDFFLFLKVMHSIVLNQYDCIHTHEEAGFLGAFINKILGISHVYDMHSNLSEQMANYRIIREPFFLGFARAVEQWLLKNSTAIITICPYLAKWVEKNTDGNKVFLIENLPLFINIKGESEKDSDFLKKFKEKGNKIVLYTGNFEYNQGIDILIEAASYVTKSSSNVKFILVGGRKKEILKYREYSKAYGLNRNMIFTGEKKMAEIPTFLNHADILISPRKIGNNTPLKIYSYLFSGKPIVATAVLGHTQILTEEISVLTETSGEGIAGGVLKLLKDEKLGKKLGQTAREFVLKKYSHEQYISKIRKVYQLIEGKRSIKIHKKEM